MVLHRWGTPLISKELFSFFLLMASPSTFHNHVDPQSRYSWCAQCAKMHLEPLFCLQGEKTLPPWGNFSGWSSSSSLASVPSSSTGPRRKYFLAGLCPFISTYIGRISAFVSYVHCTFFFTKCHFRNTLMYRLGVCWCCCCWVKWSHLCNLSG